MVHPGEVQHLPGISTIPATQPFGTGSQGGLIEVVQGTLRGSSSYQSSYTNNLGGLQIDGGAIFDGVEGTILVDALTGSGTLQGGFGTNAGSTTIGVAGGSGTFTGVIQDGMYGPMALIKAGIGTETLTGTNTYTRGTTIIGGTLQTTNNGSALSSGTVTVGTGATLNLNDTMTGTRLYLHGTTLSGSGTIVKSGAGEYAFGNNGGTVNVSLGYGGMINVVAGTLDGSSAFQANYANNMGGLNIASGATFDGVEGTILVDTLTGSGTLQGGFGTTNGSTTIGVAGSSATFSGVIRDGVNGVMTLIKAGAGTQTLTGASTYTGGITIKGGTLQLGNGTTTGSITGKVANGGTLAFNEASGTPLTFAGPISNNGNAAGIVSQIGGTTVLTGTNTYTGGTNVTGGTLETHNNGSALSSGPVMIASGATLDLDDDQTGSRLFFQGTTLSGAGTITKTSAGELAFGNNGGTVNVALGMGGVNVAAGKLDGSAAFQANYAGNQGSLNIASGATFDGVEGTILVDALNGSGTLQGGFGSNTGTTTIGVAGGYGTFSGVIQDGANGVMILIKAGAGMETLSGADTYTGGTTIKSGTLTISNGSALSSGPVVINAGATLNLNAIGTQYLAGTTLSGAGTIQVSGFGTTAFGNNGGTVNIALSKGALINVGTGGGGAYGGNLSGSADFQANWANNRASLNIGIGGRFNGVEGNIVVDALTGGSYATLSGGYGGQGSITIGVAGGSGGFGGTISDSQYGALVLIKAGAGTEALSGADTYTGGTTITGGKLELTTATAAGKGTITFANTGAAATLMIDAGAETQVNSSSTYTFSNQINGATSKNQIIDLTGLAFNTNEPSTNTATLSGGVLSVTNGTQTVKLTVGNPDGSVFTTIADAGGGTLVMDPPTSGDGTGGKVDNSWIIAAMQPFGAGDGGVGLQLGPTHDPLSAASLAASVDPHAALASGLTTSRPA